MTLEIGDKAPDFTITTDTEPKISLKDFLGKKVVLYFYPKDNTPGCTKEACGFRDNYKKISDKNAVIIGISKDSAKKHANFREKFGLPFYLGADEDGRVCNKYGVWVKKSMYGREYMGIQRATFLIDEQGNIAKIWSKAKGNEQHSEEVLAEL